MRNIAAIDIGGTKIASGIVREDGVVLARVEEATRPAEGFAPAVRRMQQMLKPLVERHGPVAGLGIACPGPLDPATGVLGSIGTLPGWEGGNLVDAFALAPGLSVAVENDADAATLAHSRSGAPTSGTLLYVTVSTGIGGGLVHRGELYRGVFGSHPEFGHQVIDRSGPLCYCGLSGCWESLASGTAMSAWHREIAPSSEQLSAAEICDRARDGDALALRVIERERHYLALGLANLVTLFCPSVISLGGGVMQSGDLFLDSVRQSVQSLCTQVPVEHITIRLSPLGPDLGLLGAAQSWIARNP